MCEDCTLQVIDLFFGNMGEVRATVLLENQGDRILAAAGYLESSRIRRVEINALVDTGQS